MAAIFSSPDISRSTTMSSGHQPLSDPTLAGRRLTITGSQPQDGSRKSGNVVELDIRFRGLAKSSNFYCFIVGKKIMEFKNKGFTEFFCIELIYIYIY